MSIVLRDYQHECVQTALKHLKKKRKGLIQLPTGGGKTIIFWSVIQQGFETALIVVPSMQLAEQCWLQGLNFFSKFEISRKYGRFNEKPKAFHITTIQSLRSDEYANLIRCKNYELMIIDEAHKAGAENYLNAIERIGPAFLLGLTATPTRSDASSLSEVFGELIYQKSIISLIEDGHLCNMKGLRIKTQIDIKNVKSSDGDFSNLNLYRCLNNDERNSLIVKSYLEHCRGLKTLLFAINIDHCLILEKMFRQQGIEARAIHGKMSFNQRSTLLNSFREGKIECLINNQLLTEGFDEPSIQCLLFARPTQSRVLYHQMIGRGLRPHPSKDVCQLIEMADNYHRLCNFWSLHVEDPYFNLGKEGYSDGMTILDQEKKWLDLQDVCVKKEEMAVFHDPLDHLEFNYLKADIKTLFPVGIANAFSIKEMLFIKWKIYKLQEMRNGNNR